jgi:HPt (histidine-containing phosphotransfer) domain-containing protein
MAKSDSNDPLIRPIFSHAMPEGSAPSPADLPPAVQAFDEADLLSRLRGNDSLANRVLRLYLTDSDHLLQKAGQVLAEGKQAELAVVAHTLKGSSLNVGAQGVARAAATLETLARSAAADVTALTRTLDSLRSALTEVRTPIEARLRRE